jgi:beta-lactamase regulating signal transducer with metallopeptidase domain
VIARELAAALDARELAAVREHEAAHARHRDPLRLLGMQLAADLQWPVPAAARRLVAWRAALELARDDEARRHGVEGEDLASGILTTARLMTGAASMHEVGAIADVGGIRARTERLLRPITDATHADARAHRRGVVPLLCAAAIAGAMIAGAAVGDDAIGLVPGVTYYVGR